MPHNNRVKQTTKTLFIKTLSIKTLSIKTRFIKKSFFSLLGALFIAAPASAVDVREVIATTLSTNPQVLAELREVDARDRQVRQALAGYYPTVDLIAGFASRSAIPRDALFRASPTAPATNWSAAKRN